MPSAEPRSPAPRRKESDVDGPCQIVHLGEEVGIASEVHRRRSAHAESDGGRGRPERTATAMMNGRYRLDQDRSDPERVTRTDLDHVVASSREHRAESCRRDDLRAPGQSPERWQMKVVVMSVRDKDRVDAEVRDRLAQVTGVP